MSYNPSVAYRGPDPATRSLTEEITAKFGPPPRPYEFVTGWKDPGNVSGHNPDSNGITHGVDIFLTPERNRWVADHLAARGRAGDKRVGYVIYAGQIASPSTGYHFAGSGWEHWDHPHLSVWDGYWGGPCTMHPSIYNDTSSWGIATNAKPLSGTTTPTKEDTLSKADVDSIVTQLTDHINAVMIGGYTWQGKKHYGIGPILEETQKRLGAVPSKVWAATISRNGKIPVIQEVADSKTNTIEIKAQLAALAAVVGQLAKGQNITIDYDKITATVQESVKESVQGALADGIDINAEITVGGAQ